MRSARRRVLIRLAIIIVVRPRMDFDRPLDFVFGLRIDRSGRVVEQEDRRIEQQRPSDRQPLPLSAGKIRALLADQRVVAVGELADEFVAAAMVAARGCRPRGSPGMSERNVRGHRIAEQKILLKHDADVPPQIVEVEPANIHTVDQYARRKGRRNNGE